MTRMKEQKQQLLRDSIKNIKALRSLMGNSADVAAVQQQLEGLKVII